MFIMALAVSAIAGCGSGNAIVDESSAYFSQFGEFENGNGLSDYADLSGNGGNEHSGLFADMSGEKLFEETTYDGKPVVINTEADKKENEQATTETVKENKKQNTGKKQVSNQTVTSTKEPELVQQTTQPEPTQQTTQPEPTQRTTQPEPVQQTTQPEPTQRTTQPEPVQQPAQPEETIQTTQTETVTQNQQDSEDAQKKQTPDATVDEKPDDVSDVRKSDDTTLVAQSIENPTENNKSEDTDKNSSDTGSGIAQTCDDEDDTASNAEPDNTVQANFE